MMIARNIIFNFFIMLLKTKISTFIIIQDLPYFFIFSSTSQILQIILYSYLQTNKISNPQKYSPKRSMQTQQSNKSSFFSSQPSTHTNPKTPTHTHINNKSSLKKTNSTGYQNLDEQKIMSQKALQFISKLRLKKKEFQGRLYIMKRAEAEKRQEEEKRKKIEEEVQKELKRQIRRMKAQSNIEYYREKKQLKQRMNSQSSSPRKRKLSQLTEQATEQSPRIILPSIHYEPTLEEIKQQQNEKFPSGLRQSSPKKHTGIIRRSKTEATDHNHNTNRQSQNEETQQINLLSQLKNPLRRIRLKSVGNESSINENKKSYLMSRNCTDNISQYLEQFSNISHFQTLSKRSDRAHLHKGMQLKNIMKTKRTPRKLPTTAIETYQIENSQINNEQLRTSRISDIQLKQSLQMQKQ